MHNSYELRLLDDFIFLYEFIMKIRHKFVFIIYKMIKYYKYIYKKT